MPLPIGDTIGILADNLKIRKSVLPISAKNATKWAEGLDLPKGGETVLYTGMMYQLIPYIEAMNKAQEKIEDTRIVDLIKYGRIVNKAVNLTDFMARPSKELRDSFDKMLANIAKLLQKAGVEFGSLYEDDLYSGALVYDLGMDDILEEHARKVYAVFKKYQVKNVITVDPHTTNMLRSVYPKFIRDYDLNVRSYMEVLVEKNIQPKNQLDMELVLHDSCVYARYENVLSQQRTLLQNAGITLKEPVDSGTFTLCCGGPAESLFPKKARESACKRVDQLKAVCSKGATMCPICLVNLHKATQGEIELQDISDYLVKAYL
ncbi:MAG: (Fe-S)-binding protein [Peptococcaceae bacterium]|nr:(Fe-S)-binding protein [Peptococcaceae bacterium]